MALKTSTGLRNGLLGASGFKDIFGNGDATHKAEIRVFSGAAPADADAAESGTLLVTIKSGSDGVTFEDPANGVIVKASGETWSGTISNAGALDAGYYRLVEGSADTGEVSTTLARVQGKVGLTSEQDIQLTVAAKALPDGQSQIIDVYQITFPGAPA